MRPTKILIILICLLLLSATKIKAAGNILIINQVRGNECCEVGSVDAVETQVSTLRTYNLPAAFALRYDALMSEYKRILDSRDIEPSLFLEIIPSLARDAGAVYKGPVERWYKAENAYLLGYSLGDRKKLIDTAFARFHQLFGVYPKTTVAWMIDSYSLNYMVERYGVTTHEITRDQWGTDSYTLYGGPIGPSYIPSKNWVIEPAKNRDSELPLTVVRQTIPDPVWNYGDSDSVFTSQPNDYLKGGFKFAYFSKLLTQALSQKPNGFAVIGLESSMPPVSQTEYLKQLKLVNELRLSDPTISIELPRSYAAKRVSEGNAVSTYLGFDSHFAAVWVNAPWYRLRIFFDEEKHAVLISDARIYGDFSDPYAQTSPLTPNAYWIVPFTVDGSRFFTRSQSRITSAILKLKSRLNLFDPCTSTSATTHEACAAADGIRLPSVSQLGSLKVDSNEIKYIDTNGQEIKLIFTPTGFSIAPAPANDVSYIPQNGELRDLNINPMYGFSHFWDGNTLKFQPWVKADLSQISTAYPDLFLPEIAGGPPVLAHSLVVVSKPIVELNRNPIRIVAYLRDGQGRVATVGAVPTLAFVRENLTVQSAHPETSLGEYYLDANPQHTGEYIPVVSLNGETKILKPVLVVPNCIAQLKACVEHPKLFINWLKMLVQDRLRH